MSFFKISQPFGPCFLHQLVYKLSNNTILNLYPPHLKKSTANALFPSHFFFSRRDFRTSLQSLENKNPQERKIDPEPHNCEKNKNQTWTVTGNAISYCH